MQNGKSTKCDGCASTVASGGVPWCVQTCPAQALVYDTRDNILTEAHRRADAIKGRYRNAQVYGETQAGGLGMILVLPDDPETLDIPADPPPVPVVTDVWKQLIQPASMAATAMAAIGAGVLGVIARRNHMAELRAIEESELVVAGATDSEGGD
jgi:formate dehydrogenase iron-sulfur subunit